MNKDKEPSCFLNFESEQWHCFSCKGGGDLSDFVAMRLGVKIKRGVDEDILGIKKLEVESEKEEEMPDYEKYEKDVRGFKELRDLMVPRKFATYLEERGIGKEAENEFDVRCGWETSGRNRRWENRIIFPIDMGGTCVGYVGRKIEEESKRKRYLYATGMEVAKCLWNYDGVEDCSNGEYLLETERIYVVEGIIKGIRLWQEGYRRVVAILGSNLSDGQARLLAEKTNTVCLCLDNDEAGKEGTASAIERLWGLVDVIEMAIPKKNGWDEMNDKEIEKKIRGRTRFKKRMVRDVVEGWIEGLKVGEEA